MVIARKNSRPLTQLFQQLDQAVARHKDADLRGFAVFLTEDSDETEAALKELAGEAKLSENLPLTLMENPAGPPNYDIHKDAEVTVLLYTKGEVVKNFAFRAGELKEADVKRISAAIPEILPDEEELEQKASTRGKVDALKRQLEEAAKKRQQKKKSE